MGRLRSAWMENEQEFSSGFDSISRRMWWGSRALKHFCNLETSRWQFWAHKAGDVFSHMLLYFPFPALFFLMFMMSWFLFSLVPFSSFTYGCFCVLLQRLFFLSWAFSFFVPSCLCFFVLALVYSLCSFSHCSWARSLFPLSTDSQCS